jgi:hypothetical protein
MIAWFMDHRQCQDSATKRFGVDWWTSPIGDDPGFEMPHLERFQCVDARNWKLRRKPFCSPRYMSAIVRFLSFQGATRDGTRSTGALRESIVDGTVRYKWGKFRISWMWQTTGISKYCCERRPGWATIDLELK